MRRLDGREGIEVAIGGKVPLNTTYKKNGGLGYVQYCMVYIQRARFHSTLLRKRYSEYPLNEIRHFYNDNNQQ